MKLYIPYEDHDGRHVLAVNPRHAHYSRSSDGHVTVSLDIVDLTNYVTVARGIYLSYEDAQRVWNADWPWWAYSVAALDYHWASFVNNCTGDVRAEEVASVSVTNHRSECTPEQAVKYAPWDALVAAMDDETREAVAADWDGDEDDHVGFLSAYLKIAPCDLIIG